MIGNAETSNIHFHFEDLPATGFRKLPTLPRGCAQAAACTQNGNMAPPTAERVKVMAELLDGSADEWTALAGRVPDDLPAIIHSHPIEMPALIREADRLNDEQLRQVRSHIREIIETAK